MPSEKNPDPDSIRAARGRTNLTQAQAAALIYSSMRAWQQWESGERRMHPAFWELFQLKTTTILDKIYPELKT